MKSTQELIEYNEGRIQAIDEMIDEHRKENNTTAIRELQERAGRTEKRIKRYKELDALSGNELNEIIDCLDNLIYTLEERCHVTLPPVEKVVREQLEEYKAELSRRIANP
jgi:hypothetical protein